MNAKHHVDVYYGYIKCEITKTNIFTNMQHNYLLNHSSMILLPIDSLKLSAVAGV